MTEPPAELLNSLLRRVAAKRRTRLWRGAVAVAASAVIAAGAATVGTELVTSGPPTVAETASAANAQTHVAAVVDYTETPWHGTTMRVQVSGIKPGTFCDFWIIGPNGRSHAGSWTVIAPYGHKAWYSVSSPVQASTVHSFQITSAGRVLVNIPAA